MRVLYAAPCSWCSDTAVTALFFLGAGIGLRDSELGTWAFLAGVMGTLGVVASEYFAERIDKIGKDSGEKAYPGIFGFDFDDILYLFAPIIWLGWQMPFVLGASIGAPIFALVTYVKLCKKMR